MWGKYWYTWDSIQQLIWLIYGFNLRSFSGKRDAFDCARIRAWVFRSLIQPSNLCINTLTAKGVTGDRHSNHVRCARQLGNCQLEFLFNIYTVKTVLAMTTAKKVHFKGMSLTWLYPILFVLPVLKLLTQMDFL